MKMENVTMLQIKDFAIVAIAIMGFIVLLGNVVKVFKDWSKPKMDINETIKDHEDRVGSLEEGQRVICKALMAIMSHEINGNSIDKLQKAYDDMGEYLIDK